MAMASRASQRTTAKRPVNYADDGTDPEEKNTEHMIQDACLYILSNERQKSFTSQADLRKDLEITSQHQFKSLLREVDKRFLEIMDTTLVHYEGKIFPVSNITKRPSSYRLINPTAKRDGFVTTLLTMIFMEQNNTPPKIITEDKLREMLEAFHIKVDGYDSNVGEDIPKLVGRQGELVKQGWLSCRKQEVEGRLDAQYVYEWGPRAVCAIDPMNILKWFCEADGSNPEEWTKHMEKAKEMQKRLKELHKSKY